MANDSTNAGQVASEQDTTPINDGYFTEIHGEDAFFAPEQLAQASAGGAPVVVPVPQDQNVIRVQVNPGEIIELSSPFDGSAALLGREADGNLAIRVGDVTVILVGFVDANSAAPVVVETSDGHPIDIAALLASTDPAIDIQTAAGPGDAVQGGQGADNTGAILAQLGLGNGLGGLNAVGTQDQTQLSYGLIDNSIRLDRADNLLTTSTGSSHFPGVAEPFLRDPFKTDTGSWMSFDDFKNEYAAYIDAHKGDTDGSGNPAPGGWADFTGTTATGDDSAAFFLDTSYVVTVSHSSTTAEQLNLLQGPAFFDGSIPTSNGETLEARYLQSGFPGDHSTVLLVRPSDGAVVMVFHVQEPDSTGDFHVEVYLVNRLDHASQGQDVLTVGFHTEIFTPASGGEEQSQDGTITPGPSGSVDIQDDVPVTGETDYYSFLHAESFKDAADCFSAFLGGKITDYVVTHDAGHVDEDYIFHGNHDKDNAAGPDSDPDRGDDIGDRFVVGMLNINFGADGPSGKIPEGDHATKSDPVFKDANPPALAIAGLAVGDAYPDATSHGHDLLVLKHDKLPFPFSTVEMVQVGYKLDDDTPSGDRVSKISDNVVVFTLLLQTGPNLPLFGGFVFEQCAPLDHPVGATLETNLPLNFQVIATDDDGDHPIDPVTISILVNDDAPAFSITYNNEDPRNCEQQVGVEGFSVSGDGGYGHVDHYTTKDFGHVDEDWLNGGIRKDGILLANGPGNHDTDGFGGDNANQFGDDKGGLEVCGQIKVKYGADGPSDAANNGVLALQTYDTTGGQHPDFLNGDGSKLTSDGKTLVVLESDSGHLVVGIAGFDVGTGEDAAHIEDQPVFCLDLNSNGKFDFHLLGAIDHNPATVNGDPESNQVLSFKVGSATDFDGDQAWGSINIELNDDKPEVGITYRNELPGSGGDDGVATKYDSDFGRIDEDWLKDPQSDHPVPNGGFEEPVVIGNFNTLNGPGGLDGWTIGDAGVDLIHDYWPAHEGEQSLDLNALNAGSISKVLTGLEVGREYTVSFDLSGNPEVDPGVKSLKVEVGSVYSNTFSSEDTTGHTFADMVWTTQSFTFVASSDTETLTFTSQSSGPCGPVLDNVTMVADEFAYGNQDKDYYGNSNANQFGDDYGSNHLSGQINAKFGADGPGTQAFGLATLSGAFEDADGNALSSGGNALVVLSSTATTLVIGYGTTHVLELTMNAFGQFDFTQLKPLDHPIASPIEDNINLAFNAGSITDGDGDTVNAVIKIQVNDDVPETGVAYSNEHKPEPDTFITYGAPVAYYGQIDEDYLPESGNHDHDNTPPFSPSDAVRGDEDGGLIVTGELGGTKFGADGPAGTPDNTFALSGLKAHDSFLDAEGNQLKSHGNLLVVLNSDGGTLEVGYHDDKGGADTAVFTLTMTSDTGFEFELKKPLDDPQNKGAPVEQGIVLVFGAEDGGAPTDKDHDPAARIVIHVNDDAPMACEVSYTTFTDASGEDSATVYNVDGTGLYGQVDEDNLATGQGNLDTDSNLGDQPGSHVATGIVTINFGADGPAGNAFALDTYNAGDTYADADGNTFASHGNQLQVLEAAADHLVVGYSDGSSNTTVFEIHLDRNTGGFSFDLQAPLDHPDTTQEDTLPVTFNVTATDFDGDTMSTKLSIHVNDDAPVVGTVSYSSGGSAGLIDEDFVAGGNSDADGAFADGDLGGGATVTGTVSVPSFAPGIGADGPAAHPYALEIFATGDAVSDADGNPLTSRFDAAQLVVISSSATTLEVGHSGGGTVFTLTLNQDTGAFTFTLSEGLDNTPLSDNLETSLPLKFNVIATDYDGDTSTTPINISVNDDHPVAVDDTDPDSEYEGNVLANDTKGADDARVTSVDGWPVGPDDADGQPITGLYGTLIMFANGDWTYEPTLGTTGGTDTFTYYIDDGDGDQAKAMLTVTVLEGDTSLRLTSLEVGPTHEPAPHYDHDVTVTGLAIVNAKDISTYHFEDATGGHLISGGAGNDYINVTGSTGAVLSGNGGDDIIHGGNGSSILSGGAGDDTLFGGTDADSFFGGAGHDAMSGGGGNDTFSKVDADDLDGTNTLDGVHSIDGGAGYDTVDISGLKTFDSSQAMHLENIEQLSLGSKLLPGVGTTVTLNYDAAYGITQVGGLTTLGDSSLKITGDKGDTVHLVSDGGHNWHDVGGGKYEAGSVGATLTVTVEGAHVDLS